MHALVVGSGIGGVTFAEELLKKNPDASVTILTKESDGYYSRPLLSHGFSREDIETKIVMRSVDTLAQSAIEFVHGVEVTELDPGAHSLNFVRQGEHETIGYDKLVLATGSDAFIPPPFQDQQALFSVFNSLTDLKALRRQRQAMKQKGENSRWAVIGGGLIGCEVASDLAVAGDKVCLFHAMSRLMERQLVDADSQLMSDVLAGSGINTYLNCAVQGFQRDEHGLTVVYEGGKQTDFSGIIVACGFKPRISLAQQAGLKVNRGILVNEFLTTSDTDIYAIGDVAEWIDGKLYAYVTPIRNQAIWLAGTLSGTVSEPWKPPFFKPKAKVQGFNAEHSYLF